METETIMEIANHEYYVSFEVAKLLKEAGFDWEVQSYYSKLSRYQGKLLWLSCGCKYKENINTNQNRYSAPTLEVAQRWLRETQKYQVAVLPNGLKGYAALCFLYKEPITQPFEHYSTYEEALEVGIKKVLELILEKWE